MTHHMKPLSPSKLPEGMITRKVPAGATVEIWDGQGSIEVIKISTEGTLVFLPDEEKKGGE